MNPLLKVRLNNMLLATTANNIFIIDFKAKEPHIAQHLLHTCLSGSGHLANHTSTLPVHFSGLKHMPMMLTPAGSLMHLITFLHLPLSKQFLKFSHTLFCECQNCLATSIILSDTLLSTHDPCCMEIAHVTKTPAKSSLRLSERRKDTAINAKLGVGSFAENKQFEVLPLVIFKNTCSSLFWYQRVVSQMAMLDCSIVCTKNTKIQVFEALELGHCTHQAQTLVIDATITLVQNFQARGKPNQNVLQSFFFVAFMLFLFEKMWCAETQVWFCPHIPPHVGYKRPVTAKQHLIVLKAPSSKFYVAMINRRGWTWPLLIWCQHAITTTATDKKSTRKMSNSKYDL